MWVEFWMIRGCFLEREKLKIIFGSRMCLCIGREMWKREYWDWGMDKVFIVVGVDRGCLWKDVGEGSLGNVVKGLEWDY